MTANQLRPGDKVWTKPCTGHRLLTVSQVDRVSGHVEVITEEGVTLLYRASAPVSVATIHDGTRRLPVITDDDPGDENDYRPPGPWDDFPAKSPADWGVR